MGASTVFNRTPPKPKSQKSKKRKAEVVKEAEGEAEDAEGPTKKRGRRRKGVEESSAARIGDKVAEDFVLPTESITNTVERLECTTTKMDEDDADTDESSCEEADIDDLEQGP